LGNKIKTVHILPKWWPYLAMQMWKWTLVKKGRVLNKVQLRHEIIHYHQQKELFLIFFFILYGLEFLIKMLIYLDWNNAYYNVSFEREAYDKQTDSNYLSGRKKFAWCDYLV